MSDPEVERFLDFHAQRLMVRGGFDAHTAYRMAREEALRNGLVLPGGEASSAYSEEALRFIAREVKRRTRKEGMGIDQALALALQEARQKGLRVPEREPRPDLTGIEPR